MFGNNCGNNGCIWLIIIIALFCCCGSGFGGNNNCGYNCNNVAGATNCNGCRCGNNYCNNCGCPINNNPCC